MTPRSLTLTREQELELITKAQAGDLKARDVFIRANMRYADYYAHKTAKRMGGDVDDLKAEAYIGLLDAFERFDVASGKRFMTYAMHWMKCHVLRWLRETRGLVHIPQKSTCVRQADRRLDALLPDNETTWLDLLAADGDPEMTLMEKERVARAHTEGQALLKELNRRERSIIEARIMRDAEDALTLRELGERGLGITRERVRQLEAIALRKMIMAAQRPKRRAA